MARHKVGAIRAESELMRRYHALANHAHSAMQHILLKIAKDKWSVAMAGPLPRFVDTFLKEWDPKRDFSFGLLHAERLTQILVDVNIARLLVKQAERFPERRAVAERWLERAEPRVRYNLDQILHTGDRMVARVKELDRKAAAEEAEEARAKSGSETSEGSPSTGSTAAA